MGVAREPWQIERTFLEAIRADPDDEAARVVYADWLEERGKNDRADFIRLDLRIRAMAPDDPLRAELERRVDRLHGVLPQHFVDAVSRPAPAPPPSPPRVRVDTNPAPRPPRLPRPEPPTLPAPRRDPIPIETDRIPTRSVLGQLFGIGEGPPPSGRPRSCWRCSAPVERRASRCAYCGVRQARLLRKAGLVAFFVLVAVVMIDELRWEMQDDNFIAGRKRSACSH